MADKVEPVVGSIPSTETVQRALHGDEGYEEIKRKEKELAEKTVKPEPQIPWPTTADVQRTIAGGKDPEPAAAQPAEQKEKAAEAEPIRARYRTREHKAEEE